MKVSEGKLGRVFMLQLEEGDRVADSVERFAAENGILSAQVFALGKDALAGIIAPSGRGKPVLRLPAGRADGPESWANSEIIIQEVVGINFQRVVDPSSGRETLAKIAPTKTRVMEKAAPVPEESGPGTIPVYLFNAEFN